MLSVLIITCNNLNDLLNNNSCYTYVIFSNQITGKLKRGNP